MPDKLTDNEIIKALECCKSDTSVCCECPYDKIGECIEKMCADSIDLINRLQAENERLKSILLRFAEEISDWGNKNNIDTTNFSMIPILESEKESLVKQIKAEAYKECIEKVKEKSKKTQIVCSGALITTNYSISAKNLDNLLKELVENEK